MQLGMVGLGRMGANMTRRLMRAGHELVVYDVNADAVRQLEGEGALASASLEDFVGKLSAPRAVWMMLPVVFVDGTIDKLVDLLEPGDTIVDGGNSYYRDDIARSTALLEKGLQYVDVGVSGGVFGLERGFCLMIGGPREAADRLDPIFADLAPGLGDIERTPGREAIQGSTAEEGYLYCGPSRAG